MTELAEDIEALPALDGLLEALEDLDPAYLVGGAVRDLLRGSGAVDADVAIEGDAIAAARVLAERMGGTARVHERFGTATVFLPDGRQADFAGTRRESYARPGALPRVEPATLDDDLGRRDFSVNAMAVALSDDVRGELHDPLGGREDLEAGQLRILHPRSFTDDPTRLLRLVRYAARLGFEVEPQTSEAARRAASERGLDTVSGTRVGNELRKILAEPDAPAAVALMDELEIASALHPSVRADPDLIALAREDARALGADPVLTALAALCGDAPEQFVGNLGLGGDDRAVVVSAMRMAPGLAKAEDLDRARSAFGEGSPAEALALASALGASPSIVSGLAADATVELEIAGSDLTAMGVPQSPAIGTVLAEVLRQKRDGRVSGHDEELELALSLVGDQGT